MSADMPEIAPEIAVVVLAIHAQPELATCVQSILGQSVPAEIVVVNSGGGDPEALLPKNVPNLRVVSVPDLLWPAGARNLGIRSTKAHWIAFISADQIALEDWLATRLALHRQGRNAVSGCVVNSHPRNVFAWASHVSLFVRRLPKVPKRQRLRHGGSYARHLFEKCGEFREDLRIGEDTEFNLRLQGPDKMAWSTDVQAIHLNPTNFRAMSKDMYERGKRYGFHWSKSSDVTLVRRVVERFRSVFPLAVRSVRGIDRVFVLAATPLILLCSVRFEMGADAGRREVARMSTRTATETHEA